MTTVITTFSKDGYDLYGRKMISTWLKYWPENYRLTVYVENYLLDEKDDRLSSLEIYDVCQGLAEFKEQSLKLDQKKSRVDKTIKWCYKVYAIKHALSVDDAYLIFLDGDTYTRDHIPRNLAADLVGNNLFAVHFEKLKHGLHFETGLVVFNLRHEKKRWLQDIITAAYDDLEIYNMIKTWDGFWLAHLYQEYSLPVKNLSAGCSGVFCNPLIKGKLVHDVGTKKYRLAGYDKFTGRKNESR
jgi:hypothetical protein